MTPLELKADQSGERCDAFLARTLPQLTRSAAQKLLEEGKVTKGGKALKKNERLKENDVVTVILSDPTPVDVVPQDITLDVVYEDDDLIVINKPVGLVVHPAPGHPDGTVVNALLHHCGGSLSGINGELRPGIVHRIDRDTSGLLIVAKNDFTHLALAEQLQDHSLYRGYEAICVGGPREDSGTIDAPIARHRTDRKKMAVDWQTGRRAVTHYTVLERFHGCTHIACRLETGRTHQIRVHMAHLGCPLTGDFLYGQENKNLIGRPALHSAELFLTHPITGEPMHWQVPLPEDMAALMAE